MKYVSLLKGTIGSIDSSDTISFLALFLTGPKSSSDYLGIYKYVIHICKQVDDVDVYNELVAMFIMLLDKFEFYPKVSFSGYITKYMRWSIKAWVMEMARNPLSKSPIEYEPYLENADNERSVNINTELPNMDLAWVSEASSPLFSVLTRYERFLLYLNYKEGLGVRQISERLGRAKDTIHAHLQQALEKLREQYKKGEQ
jgi:RNA polymerase sigma factor (sigma-70 family)